uniref:Uncharacterized protein n=1 Tax=Arundo donax TaxID=35708 RepID=A0A0A9AMM6_ARUDO
MHKAQNRYVVHMILGSRLNRIRLFLCIHMTRIIEFFKIYAILHA